MINPNFDPTWLLDMAKESEENFKQTIALMLEAHREIAASEERERIIKNLRVTFALYAGFYPEIGQAILGIIKDVDPVVHEELTKILEEKLNEDR
jgi:hypothetical protein